MILRFGRIEFDTEQGEFREEDGRYHGETYYKTLYSLNDGDNVRLGEILKQIMEEGQRSKAREVGKALMISEQIRR